MPDIPRLNLQSVQFTAPTIAPVQYQYRPTSLSILQRSLEQREARMKESAEAKANMDAALGQLETQLHNDPETNQWFSDYKADIQKQIQDEVEVGNYGSAIRTAKRLAGETAKDSGLIGRITANSEYEKFVESQRQRVGKDIDNATFNWWLANNPYKYNPAFDTSGNEVRGKLETLKAAENTISFEQLWVTAAKMVEEEANSTSTGGGYGNKPLTENETEQGVAPSHKGSNADAYHRKTSERIQEVYNELISSPAVQAQLHQAYEVAKWNYEELDKKLEDLNLTNQEAADIAKQLQDYKPLLNRNGSRITTYEEWFEKNNNQSPYARSLAYNRTVHQSEGYDEWNSPGGNPRGVGYPAGDPNRYVPNNQAGGPGVKQTVDASTAPANNAAGAVLNMFGETTGIIGLANISLMQAIKDSKASYNIPQIR